MCCLEVLFEFRPQSLHQKVRGAYPIEFLNQRGLDGGPIAALREALRGFEQELHLDCFEWKDDAPTFGTIKNTCI